MVGQFIRPTISYKSDSQTLTEFQEGAQLMNNPQLIATCWTSAGAVAPLDQPEVSPFAPLDRLQAIAETGWQGFGFGQDDLREVENTIGFEVLYARAQELGLTHIEIEIASGWWLPESSGWRENWELLLRAARVLHPAFIKVGTSFGEPLEDLSLLVEPMRKIAQEAVEAGTRIALEPLPFSMIASMPQGAELIALVDHPAAGLIVDYWHIFRANTSLEELSQTVPVGIIFGVELSDADNDIIGTLFEDTRDRRTLLTEGEQDVVGFIRTIQEMGYTGPWGVEILSSKHRERPLREGLVLARDSALKAFSLIAK